MPLKTILGSSGSGKSTDLFKKIIEESIKNPTVNYLIIVPEQFTMSTQKELVSMHPSKGIMNIDVLSFQRLAYRIFDETGAAQKIVLEDTGKNLILKKLVSENKDNLSILKGNIEKAGYIKEVKSLISEFFQYGISPKELEKLIQDNDNRESLNMKLTDILFIYRRFKEYIEEDYITAEEVIEVLSDVTDKSNIIKNSVIAFDGFTGFTPLQYKLLSKLMIYAKDVIVTVTIDKRQIASNNIKEHELFRLSKETISKLEYTAKEAKVTVEKPEIKETEYRFRENAPMLFLEQNLFRYGKKKYNKEQENISIHICKNPLDEIDFAARTVKELVRNEGYRYRDIGVVTGDMETYGKYVSDVMNKYDIPYFMDYKRNILKNPFIECIRAIIEMIEQDFSYQSVFRYLKSGFSRLEYEKIDLLENYCIAFGIRGFSRWNKSWRGKRKTFTDEDLVKVNKIREIILDRFKELVPTLKSKDTTVREKTEKLYIFIVQQEFQKLIKKYENYFKSINELALSKEYAQVYKIVIDLFDKFVALLGNEKMSIDEYSLVLDSGFEEAKIGIIPPGLDMLLIGDIERTRLNHIKALIFVGVNEGIIPSSDNGGGIISQTEREFLSKKVEIAPTVRERSYIQKFYLYLNMTKPSDKLFISLSKVSSEGKTLRNSYLIGSIKQLYENILIVDEEKFREDFIGRIYTKKNALDYLTKGFAVIKDKEPSKQWIDLYRCFMNTKEYRDIVKKLVSGAFYVNIEESIGSKLAVDLYGKILSNSVTRLEYYSRCAYAHFLSYGLHLSEREEYSFEGVDMGNIMHISLEKFSKMIDESNYNWNDIPKNIRTEYIKEAVKSSVEELEADVLHNTARNEYIITRMIRILDRTAWALSQQLKTGVFKPADYEIPFHMSGDTLTTQTQEKIELFLNGRIDRLDVCEDNKNVYFKVIDYKTGKKEFSLTEFYYGLSLQLLVYMNAAIEVKKRFYSGKEMIPAGLFYYHIDDPIVESEQDDESNNIRKEMIDRKILEELRPSGLINSDEGIVEKMDNFSAGKSYSIPAAKTKNGALSKNGNVANKEQFKKLSKYVDKKIKDIGEEIVNGNIKIEPYELNGNTGCDYCTFAAVCRFEQKLEGYGYKRLAKLNGEELWNRIEKDSNSLESKDDKLNNSMGEGEK